MRELDPLSWPRQPALVPNGAEASLPEPLIPQKKAYSKKQSAACSCLSGSGLLPMQAPAGPPAAAAAAGAGRRGRGAHRAHAAISAQEHSQRRKRAAVCPAGCGERGCVPGARRCARPEQGDALRAGPRNARAEVGARPPVDASGNCRMSQTVGCSEPGLRGQKVTGQHLTSAAKSATWIEEHEEFDLLGGPIGTSMRLKAQEALVCSALAERSLRPMGGRRQRGLMPQAGEAAREGTGDAADKPGP